MLRGRVPAFIFLPPSFLLRTKGFPSCFFAKKGIQVRETFSITTKYSCACAQCTLWPCTCTHSGCMHERTVAAADPANLYARFLPPAGAISRHFGGDVRRAAGRVSERRVRLLSLYSECAICTSMVREAGDITALDRGIDYSHVHVSVR